MQQKFIDKLVAKRGGIHYRFDRPNASKKDIHQEIATTFRALAFSSTIEFAVGIFLGKNFDVRNRLKIRRRPGDVFVIPLGGQFYSFGRVLNGPLVAFYDLRATGVPDIDCILAANVIFRIWVMDTAIASGHWPVVGNRLIEPYLLVPPRFYSQNLRTGALRMHHRGVERPATIDDVRGLECAVIWEPHHVEERLRDHFHGIPNETCMALQPI